MKKDGKLADWVDIVSSGRAPPLYERWTEVDDAQLLEAQSDIVKMAHMALCHLEELKKKKNWILTEPYRVQEEYRYKNNGGE